ncbi:MAG: aryl-sulfate sulfotransferase [Chloroflexota bacterium]
MRYKTLLVIGTCLLAAFGSAAAQTLNYVSPKPNSIYHSRTTNVILRFSERIDASTVGKGCVALAGEKSGAVPGYARLSDDGMTITFEPAAQYAAGETITARFDGSPKTIDGKPLPATQFIFKTTPLDSPIRPAAAQEKAPGAPYALQDGDLPTDFPEIQIKNSNNPAPGYYFIANPAQIPNYGNFVIMADNQGQTVAWKRTKVRGYDFNMQDNGLYSYADAVLPKGWFWANVYMYVLDKDLAIVDSFQCGNGYVADMHEFKWLPNGHALLLAQDPQKVDMSKYFQGGVDTATVAGSIIQELDADRKVVFQWRSWDHLDFGETYEDTLAPVVNPFHFNALDYDTDGNLLVSVRHTCQIIKISRATGEIMWRLGGKKNQFTFSNDYEPIGGANFSHQHNIKRIANGNITFYDNGWIRKPQFSRGVEYKLDEANKTATKVWEYRHTPDIYTELMGSVQRLSNGNTVICWGGPNPEGRELMTEVHADNSIALEMTFPPLFTSYRIYKHEIPGCQPTASVYRSELLQNNVYEFNNDSVKTGVTMVLRDLSTFAYNSVFVKKYDCSALYPQFEGKAPSIFKGRYEITEIEIDSCKPEITFDLNLLPEITNPAEVTVYKRDTIGSGVFYPLTTEYNAEANALKAYSKNFGEYIFGKPDILSAEEETSGELAVSLEPNPVADKASFKAYLPKGGELTLKVYDMLGTEIATIAEGRFETGLAVLNWNAAGIAPGCYVYALSCGESKAYGKIVISK